MALPSVQSTASGATAIGRTANSPCLLPALRR
jgi:hypothetical protein